MSLQGTGIYLWNLREFEGGNAARIVDRVLATQLSYVFIKIANQGNDYGHAGRNRTVTRALQAQGVKVWGWHYITGVTTDASGNVINIVGAEVNAAVRQIRRFRLDGYIANAESKFQTPGSAARAESFMKQLRARVDDVPIGLSAFKFPSLFHNYPWKAFLERSEFNLPQTYWVGRHDPEAQVADPLWQFLLPDYVRLADPRVDEFPARFFLPTGSAYSDDTRVWLPEPQDQERFLERSCEIGLPAVSYYNAGKDTFTPTTATPPPNDKVSRAGDALPNAVAKDAQLTFQDTLQPTQLTAFGDPWSYGQWDGGVILLFNAASFVSRKITTNDTSTIFWQEPHNLADVAGYQLWPRPLTQGLPLGPMPAGQTELAVAGTPWQPNQFVDKVISLHTGQLHAGKPLIEYHRVVSNTQNEVEWSFRTRRPVDYFQINSSIWDKVGELQADFILPDVGADQVVPVFDEAVAVGGAIGRTPRELLTEFPYGNVEFMDDDGRLMIPELIIRTNSLARLVLREFGQDHGLRVLRGYRVSGIGEFITRDEGRALHFVVQDANEAKLRRLARLARQVGFSWVKHVADIRASASDGTTDAAGTQFDSVTYNDWTSLDINTDEYVLIVTRGAPPGSYELASIDAEHLTVTSAIGANASGITFQIRSKEPYIHASIRDTLALWGPEREQELEGVLWEPLRPIVQKAFSFWENWLGLRRLDDGGNNVTLGEEFGGRFLRLIRAVSWATSRHGTSGRVGFREAQDPMQVGEIRSASKAYWRSLAPVGPSSETTLANAVTSSAVTVLVRRVGGFDQAGVRIRIEDEVMFVKSTRNLGTNIELTVLRHIDGTAATSHSANTPVVLQYTVPVERSVPPIQQTTLNGSISRDQGDDGENAVRTTITVNGSANFPSDEPFRIQLANEFMLVESRNGNSWHVRRMSSRSLRRAHVNGASIRLIAPVATIASDEMAAVVPYESELFPWSPTAAASLVPKANLALLDKACKGNENPEFTVEMSYFWGTFILLHMVNCYPNVALESGNRSFVWRCGDCSWPRLVGGAVRYGKSIDSGFRDRLLEILFGRLRGDFIISEDLRHETLFEHATMQYVPYPSSAPECFCPSHAWYGGRRPGETQPEDGVDFAVSEGTKLVAVVDGEWEGFPGFGDLPGYGQLTFDWSPTAGETEKWKFVFFNVTHMPAPGSITRGTIVGRVGAGDFVNLRLSRLEPLPDGIDSVDPVYALGWLVMHHNETRCGACQYE